MTAHDDYYARSERDQIEVIVVGSRPRHEPYVWIGRDSHYIDSVNVEQATALARAILRRILRRVGKTP